MKFTTLTIARRSLVSEQEAMGPSAVSPWPGASPLVFFLVFASTFFTLALIMRLVTYGGTNERPRKTQMHGRSRVFPAMTPSTPAVAMLKVALFHTPIPLREGERQPKGRGGKVDDDDDDRIQQPGRESGSSFIGSDKSVATTFANIVKKFPVRVEEGRNNGDGQFALLANRTLRPGTIVFRGPVLVSQMSFAANTRERTCAHCLRYTHSAQLSLQCRLCLQSFCSSECYAAANRTASHLPQVCRALRQQLQRHCHRHYQQEGGGMDDDDDEEEEGEEEKEQGEASAMGIKRGVEESYLKNEEINKDHRKLTSSAPPWPSTMTTTKITAERFGRISLLPAAILGLARDLDSDNDKMRGGGGGGGGDIRRGTDNVDRERLRAEIQALFALPPAVKEEEAGELSLGCNNDSGDDVYSGADDGEDGRDAERKYLDNDDSAGCGNQEERGRECRRQRRRRRRTDGREEMSGEILVRSSAERLQRVLRIDEEEGAYKDSEKNTASLALGSSTRAVATAREKILAGIVRRHAIPLDQRSIGKRVVRDAGRCVAVAAGLFGHSCAPNCAYRIDYAGAPDTGTAAAPPNLTIEALTRIPAHTPLSLCFLPSLHYSATTRRAELQARGLFPCGCLRCELQEEREQLKKQKKKKKKGNICGGFNGESSGPHQISDPSRCCRTMATAPTGRTGKTADTPSVPSTPKPPPLSRMRQQQLLLQREAALRRYDQEFLCSCGTIRRRMQQGGGGEGKGGGGGGVQSVNLYEALGINAAAVIEAYNRDRRPPRRLASNDGDGDNSDFGYSIATEKAETIIKRGYLREIRKWHPDKNRQQKALAHRKAKLIDKAYAILSEAALTGQFPPEKGGRKGRQNPAGMYGWRKQGYYPKSNENDLQETKGGEGETKRRNRKTKKGRGVQDAGKNEHIDGKGNKHRDSATGYTFFAVQMSKWMAHAGDIVAAIYTLNAS
eukprot:jgi/Bigna1/74527/fgenesh1_pg.29_\